MKGQWLYKPVIISNEYATIKTANGSIIHAVELDVCKNNWLDESRLLTEMIRKRLLYFMIMVHKDGREFAQSFSRIADFVGLFSMGASYESKNEQPLIGLQGINRDAELIKYLSGHMTAQGFEHLFYLDFPGDNELRVYSVSQENVLFTVSDSGSRDGIQVNMEMVMHILGQYVCFKGNTFEDSFRINTELHKRITEMLNKNDLHRTLILCLLEAVNKLENIERDYTLQTRKLSIAESFAEVAKNKYKDDYKLLFEYYHNEYEVLPAWYKRIGHIIKVMIGKRMFRSLFKDRVKKHRK